MFGLLNLPVRVFDDLRVEADPGARLTPDQAQDVAHHLIATAVQKRIVDRIDAPTSPAPRSRRKVAA